MARPTPLSLEAAASQPDHSDWQVVLSDPSKRRVVLYSRNLNRLSIEPTPPPSPTPHARDAARRGNSSRRRRSWSGLSYIDGSSDGDAIDGEGGRQPAQRTSSPLASSRTTTFSRKRKAHASSGGHEERQIEDDDEAAAYPSGTGLLTDVVPESVCPLCLQILPPSSSSATGAGRSEASSSAGTTGRNRTPRQRQRRQQRRLFPLLPPPTGFLPDSDADPYADGGNDSDQSSSAAGIRTSTSRNAVVFGGDKTVAGTTYFELLSEANSLANTPTSTGGGGGARIAPAAGDSKGKAKDEGLDSQQMNEGYYARFFDEVSLLGRGGQGAVYLVRHMLNGEALGLYACKKVPVGDSTPSLLSILREVHMLESASHPNIVAYHHAWLETTAPTQSRFVPKVPTLHILMEFANGGSLQGFVDARKGAVPFEREEEEEAGGTVGNGHRAAEAARRQRRGAREQAVHLLRLDDIFTLFEEVARGLAFLHGRNILHLDLKAENVLLHWEDNALLPTCKLSDFGSASSDSYHRERIGGSGTLAYTPPEALFPSPVTGHFPAPERTTDMWALGLILHLLVFFALPFAEAGPEGDTKRLEEEIKVYKGFQATDPLPRAASARHDLPPSLLQLLSQLINHDPSRRPSCDRVLSTLRLVRQDVARGLHAEPGVGTVVRANTTAGAVWSRRFHDGTRRRERRSLSDGSMPPWEEREGVAEDLQAEVVEVEDFSEQGAEEDDLEEGEVIEAGEDVLDADEYEQQQLLIHQRRAQLANQVPTSSLPRVLSISPPGRALPSPPLLAHGCQSPPFLALPSPSELPSATSGITSSAGSRDDYRQERKSLPALPWREKPTHMWDMVLRDSHARAIVAGAIAALLKPRLTVDLTQLFHYTSLHQSRASIAPTVEAASGVPLWVVALLLFETALDVSLARPSYTAAILVAHLMVMRTVAHFA
ncbi:hypothetical protein JCM10908_003360 [Rhodotorula pacifica]|uniref:protein kinase IKS1 n=1 Tax=Rhodotorula pacifica TaxID=1495444 RepID=UPI00316D9056